MFIRCTETRDRVSGEPDVTFRLVHSARVGSAIRQTTLLNLGSHFPQSVTRFERDRAKSLM